MPEVSARDTYAQWAMTGFALVATIISVVGVVLLRRTFEETKRTADAAIKSEQTARDIGQAQTRAYLSCVGGSYTVVNQLCVINLNIRNYGASPSPSAVVFGSLIVPNLHSTSPMDGFLRTEAKTAELFSIPAGGESEATLPLQISFPTKVRQELFDGEWYVSADCVLQWVDVFKDTQTINFFLIETSRSFERGENLPARRVGSMKATNVRPNQQRQE
ncbi:hypothetical protein GCM10011321_29230 [Youhaiella tibetensis]|uniref:Uncharacterized protein n=1 Tax=Paradevosia tibetensis TaxID=1447062 RepID=A0A5B9DK63_9HYPH|nr:hypothetical protein [Youhaiella tibetensis]QEE19089.1 hypothetical protein FNA67_02370 [Youhaiella tibetensis]GGF36431.1 hypothetical protein GCM10011321_29230 [Youhaiella tibetensis]